MGSGQVVKPREDVHQAVQCSAEDVFLLFWSLFSLFSLFSLAWPISRTCISNLRLIVRPRLSPYVLK